MIVAVTGWRFHTDSVFIRSELNKLKKTFDDLHFRVGDAEGVDTIALHWCLREGIPYDRYDADWHSYGKSAGPIRNRTMLTQRKIYRCDQPVSYEPERVHMLLGFPEPGRVPRIPGSGSWNCIGQAFGLGIDVVIPGHRKGL